jgi:hypothetical protein
MNQPNSIRKRKTKEVDLNESDQERENEPISNRVKERNPNPKTERAERRGPTSAPPPSSPTVFRTPCRKTNGAAARRCHFEAHVSDQGVVARPLDGDAPILRWTDVLAKGPTVTPPRLFLPRVTSGGRRRHGRLRCWCFAVHGAERRKQREVMKMRIRVWVRDDYGVFVPPNWPDDRPS